MYRRGAVASWLEKKGNSGFPQSAYKYSINFSRLHNGMAARLCIQCLEFEMKLWWRWRREEVEVAVVK